MTGMANSVRRLSTFSAHLSSQAGRHHYDYDLVVVGGGSGGLACSKEAAGLGKRVAVLDYVSPSPQGSSWGLGGTCVNVGCIPKKLMHHASLLGQGVKDASSFGWMVPEKISHSWNDLRDGVGDYIKSLNWGHRVQLKEKNVDYLNAKASFVDLHTLEAETNDGKRSRISSNFFVIATGGRPLYPENVPGAVTYGITSDDLFSLSQPPGKTLVIGASYVALECAGFLAGLGYDTSIMIRSTPLKGFDAEVVDHVMQHLEKEVGLVTVMRHCSPQEVKKVDVGGALSVRWLDSSTNQVSEDKFGTVLFATGRKACTEGLGLSEVGVKLQPRTGKVIVDEQDATSQKNIFAIGDVADNRWELTPVAIKAGKLLARRLFGDSKQLLDYSLVPTTVFTPLEMAAVGMTEVEAIATHGQHSIEVYHALYTPLEFQLPKRAMNCCYIKMVCLRDPPEKVIGLHLTGPNAGEVAQGFAVAMRCGLSRESLELSVGIHPTCAEELTKLHITKSSGVDPKVTGC